MERSRGLMGKNAPAWTSTPQRKRSESAPMREPPLLPKRTERDERRTGRVEQAQGCIAGRLAVEREDEGGGRAGRDRDAGDGLAGRAAGQLRRRDRDRCGAAIAKRASE